MGLERVADGASENLRPVWIYKTSHGFAVLVDQSWPWGRLVGVRRSLRSARRLARRHANQPMALLDGLVERIG